MRRYETIFILRPNAGEAEINRVIEMATNIIADEKGTIIEINKWGLKKLAYLVKKESMGYYVYSDYAGTPAAVAEIERRFRIDDAVLKYMTIKTAKEITAEETQNAITAVAKRDADAAARAAEEAAAEGEEKAETEVEDEAAVEDK